MALLVFSYARFRTADFSRLVNLYWFIRYHRKASIKRRYYRYVAVEKNACLKQASIRKNFDCFAGRYLGGKILTLKEG